MVVLFAIFVVIVAAAIYLERISGVEGAIWAFAAAVMTMIFWPRLAVRLADWIPLMIGMGVIDIALIFRSGFASLRGNERHS